MTTLPSIPDIGSTIHLHGGTLTRMSDARFAAITPAGRRVSSTGHQVHPNAAYIRAVNVLRKQAGLSALPVPCTKCGTDSAAYKNNSRLCATCQETHIPKTHAQRRGDDAEVPFNMQEALDTLQRLAPPLEGEDLPKEERRNLVEVGLTHSYGDDVRKVDALIVKRKQYAVLDDCLKRAQSRQVIRQSKAS